MSEGCGVDSVLRCDSCQSLMHIDTLHKLGTCSKCGNKRMRNVTIFNDEERVQMIAWGLDDFVAQFEEVSNAA